MAEALSPDSLEKWGQEKHPPCQKPKGLALVVLLPVGALGRAMVTAPERDSPGIYLLLAKRKSFLHLKNWCEGSVDPGGQPGPLYLPTQMPNSWTRPDPGAAS